MWANPHTHPNYLTFTGRQRGKSAQAELLWGLMPSYCRAFQEPQPLPLLVNTVRAVDYSWCCTNNQENAFELIPQLGALFPRERQVLPGA